jgi:hypothetical protein
VAIQRMLAEHAWPDGVDVWVRIGIHSGEAAAAGSAPSPSRTTRSRSPTPSSHEAKSDLISSRSAAEVEREEGGSTEAPDVGGPVSFRPNDLGTHSPPQGTPRKAAWLRGNPHEGEETSPSDLWS